MLRLHDLLELYLLNVTAGLEWEGLYTGPRNSVEENINRTELNGEIELPARVA